MPSTSRQKSGINMPNFKTTKDDFTIAEVDGKNVQVLKAGKLASFDTSLLDLGDVRKKATSTDSIAAVFDLQGFTNFCKQIEPHLSVPIFLSQFLEWLMAELKSEMIQKTVTEGAILWSPLPFFTKFMGDGLLVLWDVSTSNDAARRNIVISCKNICMNYQRKFVVNVRSKVVEPPPVLRCGIARGTVYSVGDGNDYVGSCINMAARLQKIPGLTFSFNLRGIDLDKHHNDHFTKTYVIKCIEVRGIGNNELVCVLKNEFEALSKKDQKLFRDV